MSRFCWGAVSALVLLSSATVAWADPEPISYHDLTPNHDTWATHNDDTVHGREEIIRVGTEPQECEPDGWTNCDEDTEECCVNTDGYNYCAPVGQCATTTPVYSTHRKFRGYIRFDLSELPDGKVVSAFLSFKPEREVEFFGGPPVVEVVRLKRIGMDVQICEWDEDTLNDTNGTTWSSLPQNVSVTPEGRWSFDVTKALQDWLEGDSDSSGEVAPNCGFHLTDPDYGNADHPIARWVDFSSKEGSSAPLLSVRLAHDLDQDGWYGDCDETNPAINPGATEVCDQIDNDCDDRIDEEDCDGLDNDCNGITDDGLGLCGPGELCVAHECVATCEDECASTYDLECRQEEGGPWQVWGCGHKDSDPCLDRYYVEDCDDDEFCEFGYCSGNCVDMCEPEEVGGQHCHRDELGFWYLAECGDWDADGCLEWGQLEACGPSAMCCQDWADPDGPREECVPFQDLNPCGVGVECTQPLCVGGCADECPTLGVKECADAQTVRICYDSDDDGCLEWTETETCDADTAQCDQGLCVPLVICENQCPRGRTTCSEAEGQAAMFTCVEMENGCFDWGDPVNCVWGCDSDGESCADPPPEDIAPRPDVVDPPPADVVEPVEVIDPPVEDVVTPPVEDVVTPAEDTVVPPVEDVQDPAGDDVQNPGPVDVIDPALADMVHSSGDGNSPETFPGTDTGGTGTISFDAGGSGGGSDDGGSSGSCQAGGAGSGAAPVMLLLLAAAALLLRRRFSFSRQ